MTRNALASSLFVLATLLVLGTPLTAQDTPPTSQQNQTQLLVDSVDLVFEREIFVYPSYERRNPFTSLMEGSRTGPRFEELQLIGVVLSTNPENSIAVFGPSTRAGVQGTGGMSYRVRRGDTLGNIRILEIQQTRVVVAVEEFGLTEQRIMELRRPGQGGL